MGKKAAPTPSFAKKAPVVAKATNPLFEKRAKSFGECLSTSSPNNPGLLSPSA